MAMLKGWNPGQTHGWARPSAQAGQPVRPSRHLWRLYCPNASQNRRFPTRAQHPTGTFGQLKAAAGSGPEAPAHSSGAAPGGRWARAGMIRHAPAGSGCPARAKHPVNAPREPANLVWGRGAASSTAVPDRHRVAIDGVPSRPSRQARRLTSPWPVDPCIIIMINDASGRASYEPDSNGKVTTIPPAGTD
jgi:hypothetical protein